MLLLIFCICLQVLLINERILNKLLLVFVQSRRSQVRKQADNVILSGMFAQFLSLTTLPLQLVIALVKSIVANLFFSIVVMLFIGVIVTLAESSSSILAVYVNTYNNGVGELVDVVIIKPLQLLDLLFRSIIPLYNAAIWAVGRIFVWVVLPFTNVHINRIPHLILSLIHI